MSSYFEKLQIVWVVSGFPLSANMRHCARFSNLYINQSEEAQMFCEVGHC